MIHIKDGVTSSYKKLYALDPKAGDTFISEDGTILAFIQASSYVVFVRTVRSYGDKPILTTAVVSDFSLHHQFKRVEVDLTVRAV